MKHILKAALAASLFVVSMVTAHAQSFTMAALSGISGSSYGPNAARSLNNSGQACGASRDSGGTQKPVFWSSPSTCVDLGLLDVYSGAYGEALGLNTNGVVVGYTTVRGSGSPQPHAFVWQSGTMTDITPSGWTYAFAFSVNENNIVLGSGTTGYGAQLFTYNLSTGVYTYFTVPTSIVAQRGTLNASGVATASVATWSYPTITPIWDSVNATSFNIAESGYLAYPYRMNNNGQICGQHINSSTSVSTAFVWTPSGVNGTAGWTTDLGKPVGSSYTVARGINSFGHTVGQCDSSPPYGFIWYGGSLLNLNSLTSGAGTSIRDAWDINDHQQVLVATYSSGVDGFAILTRS